MSEPFPLAVARNDAEAAMLRAIHEEPHADANRLIYADWLEEHGETDKAAWLRAFVGFDGATAGRLGQHIDLNWRVAVW